MFDLIKYHINKNKGGNSGDSSNKNNQTSVSIDSFISAALIGLGLSPQVGNNTAFNQIVSNCKAWLQTATIDGLEILSTASGLALSLISPVDGAFYVRKNVIEGIKDWLFDSDTISYSPGLSCSSFVSYSWFSCTKGSMNLSFNKKVSLFTWKYQSQGYDFPCFLAFCSEPFTIYTSGFAGDTTSKITSIYNGIYYYQGLISPWCDLLSDLPLFSQYESDNMYKSILDGSIPSSFPSFASYPDGISVSDVVPQVGEDIEITYIDWKELEKQVQEGEGSSEDPTDPTNPAPIPLVPYWPIWSPQFSNPDSTLDDVMQSDVWQSGSDPNWNPGSNIENKNSSPILWWGKTK